MVKLEILSEMEPLQRCPARDTDNTRCGDTDGHEGLCSWHPSVEKLWTRIAQHEMPCPLCSLHPRYRYADHSAMFEEAP